MSETPANRRKFSRVSFVKQLTLTQGDRQWPCQLIDLSLHGMLIEEPDNWQADKEHPFSALLELSDEASITMQVNWRHSENQHAGFECVDIDIDSISHLRQLVALNLGDAELLERELALLSE